MFRLLMLLTIAACALAVPAVAQAPAPATTAFDGKYAGVSRNATRTPAFPGAKCPPSGVPAPLTIKNGVVGTPGGQGWEGTVSPQGTAMLHNSAAMRLEAQIDAQGTIRAQYGGAGCTMTYVWHKQSG
jgi:hypothetical protein